MAIPQQHDPGSLLTQLAQPSSAYKRRVWLAVTGLALFLVLYVLLAGWFLFTAYNLTLGAASPTFTGYLVGACALILAVFMLKPFFFLRHGAADGVIPITPQQQPRLFAFLHELADSAASPRPHKVFLSSRVNAAVFYDLSPINLFLPSRKNLEIGLALVNVLSLGEFRAVLAHEFGHFTQRSMAVMRWVYIAQQISAHLVARRDKLDQALDALSHFDLRVAWVGWLLSLIVWSIRSLVDTAFRLLLLAQRALSREMEMQADLVAVSLTGSDALIHALHRLQAADDSWERTCAFVGGQVARNRVPRDVFTLHSHVVERIGDILSDPGYGHVAPVPADRPAEHRVFTPELGQPPQMWLTHPLNHEREANAKRHYVSAPIDDRSAWTLFDTPATLREQVSAAFLASPGKETVPGDESVDALNKSFARESYRSRYRGLYLGRSVVRSARRPEALIEPAAEGWRQKLDQLYPASLNEDIAHWRNLEKEIGQLRALQSGALQPPDGVIRHRGRAITPKDLPGTIAHVEREAQVVEDRLQTEDRACRTVHHAAALELGGGWAPYLQGLLAALHYADHSATNLQDLHGLLAHTWNVVTVTGRVGSTGMQRLVDAASALHRALGDLHGWSNSVQLDASLLQRLEVGSWTDALGAYTLSPPDNTNIGEWLKVIDGWVGAAVSACSALRSAALEQLLLTEAAVADHIRQGTAAGSAPAPSVLPSEYAVLLPGAERKPIANLNWWQRFQIADGVVPAIARVAVAAGIVVAVLGFGRTVGTATITIYNGLARPVVVRLGDHRVGVDARRSHALAVDARATYRIETRTAQGQVIETFDADVPGSFANFVYNVGGATPLIEWKAFYGTAARAPRPDSMLGAPRWTRSSADVLFTDPPESVKTSGGWAMRLVLSGMAELNPGQQLDMIANDADRDHIIGMHARWDATNSPLVATWLSLAQTQLGDFGQILAARLAETPNDVLLLRWEQDAADVAGKAAVCARHLTRAEHAPADADLAYLAARCQTDDEARTQAFLDGHGRWPTHGWLAMAAGYSYAEAGQWRQAITALEAARPTVRPLSEQMAVDLARIHRLVSDDPSQALAALATSSPLLRSILTLESGAGLDSTALLAYSELEHGNLDRAVQLAHADAEVEARVLRLAAASDGAPAALIARALALGQEAGLDDQTRWASIGLAARLRRDFTPLLGSRQAWRQEYVDRLLRFIDRTRAGTNLSAAEQTLDGLPPVLRGEAYSMSVIMLGTRTPVAWRRAAKRLLFASERPYFR